MNLAGREELFYPIFGTLLVLCHPSHNFSQHTKCSGIYPSPITGRVRPGLNYYSLCCIYVLQKKGGTTQGDQQTTLR